MAARTVDKKGTKPVATNRVARRDYEIFESLECGLVLKGSEVKALREAKVQLNDAYARIRDGELWLTGMHIAPYSHGTGAFNHEIDRDRKLLVHRSEINRLRARVDQDRVNLVPLSLYFKDGRAKVEIGLGKPRKHYDKREAIAKRDADLEARRAVVRPARGE
jgi:SsrA-binding protein